MTLKATGLEMMALTSQAKCEEIKLRNQAERVHSKATAGIFTYQPKHDFFKHNKCKSGK